jgi:hypothetical protein
LDLLEQQQGFTPDLLIVDYPKLMKTSAQYQRIELGNITRDLRGLAVERNMAVAAVSQSNRIGMKKSRGEHNMAVLTAENISEDFTQGQTADTVLSYNQTEAEAALGLARIHVALARDQEGGFTTLITQHYPTGQFCLKSVRMNKDNFETLRDAVRKYVGGSEESEEEEDYEEEDENYAL